MRILGVAATLLLLACGQAAASGVNINVNADCNIDSDYSFHLTERSAVFLRDTGTPHTVLMRQGRLFVDDRWVALSPEDSRRVAEYEREARAAMPLAREIGRDAAEIAFAAVGEVAASFGSDPDKTRRKLADAQRQLDARLAHSVSATRFSGDELGEAIGEAVGELVPTLIGDIVGGALRAALGGNAAQLQQLENLDQQIEALVEPRARALEKNAQALCRRMEALDRIDNALEYRLADGRALELLEIRPSRYGKRRN